MVALLTNIKWNRRNLMLDGFKIQLPKTMRSSLIHNEKLEWKCITSHKTGVPQTEYLFAEYPKGAKAPLRFKIKGNYIELSGSFHKYAQQGNNYEYFSFDDLQATIQDLCRTFQINPDEAIL